MDRRWVFWGGIGLSVAVSALLYVLGVPGFFFALFVPFFLVPGARRELPRCKACGTEAANDAKFCARCGATLDASNE